MKETSVLKVMIEVSHLRNHAPTYFRERKVCYKLNKKSRIHQGTYFVLGKTGKRENVMISRRGGQRERDIDR